MKKGKAKEKHLAQTLEVLFEGKKVQISARVLEAWKHIREDTSVTDLVESTISAIDRKRDQSMTKLLTSEVNEKNAREKYFKENPYGPDIFNEYVKLQIAIDDGEL